MFIVVFNRLHFVWLCFFAVTFFLLLCLLLLHCFLLLRLLIAFYLIVFRARVWCYILFYCTFVAYDPDVRWDVVKDEIKLSVFSRHNDTVNQLPQIGILEGLPPPSPPIKLPPVACLWR